MSFYFRTIPNFEYNNPVKDSPITDYIQVKNLFKKSKLREDIFGSLVYFTKYNVIGNERPDQIAEKFYGDSTLDWVILLSNNIQDVRSEWPLDNQSFDRVMLEKYGSYENLYATHHYETVEVKNSNDVVVLPAGLKMPPTWKTNGNFIEVNCQKINKDQVFCGDGVIPSNVATVTFNEGIRGLQVNDEVTIQNVSDPLFNGTFRVTEVYIPFIDETQEYQLVNSFNYELPSVPSIAKPESTSTEQVLYTLYQGSLSGNVYFFEYQDQQSVVRLASSKILNPVSNYDYELNLNNKKREIYVLKPTYLGIILNDAEAASSYKIGGTQFVNDTLKRGDNLKIYS